MTFTIEEFDNQIFGVVDYRCDLWEDRTIARLIDDYQAILHQIVASPSRKISDFRHGRSESDLIVGRELSVTTYLVGELNRRLGNHREALNWYVNAGRTTEGDPRVAWLDRLIDRQSKLAREQAA